MPVPVNEFMEECTERLAKQCYIEGDYIIINIAYEYPVELRRCSTPESILGLVAHLAGKTWMTRDVLGEFVNLAAAHHNIKIHPIPN